VKKWFGPATETVTRYRDAREADLVRMDGADKFLAGCLKWGVQLILFGHQHYPYQRLVVAKGQPQVDTPFGRRVAALRAFCCPTTLQYDAKGNGFYLFDFSSRSQVEWVSMGALRAEGEGLRPLKQLQRSVIDMDAEPTNDEKLESYQVDLDVAFQPS
jgi:hypothetical protein